ncbi:hypothetical protein D3C76_1015860 [compost metagenome]
MLDRHADAFQSVLGGDHLIDTGMGLVTALAGDIHSLVGSAVQRLDDGLDGFGRLLGLERQRPYLIGDHGKPTALLAGPRRFDGGIEGQQVGLVGDLANHVRGDLDRLGFVGEVLHRLTDLVHRVLQFLDYQTGLACLFGAYASQLVDVVGFAGSVVDVGRHLGDRCGHLGHGSGCHVGFIALALQRRLGGLGQLAAFAGHAFSLLRIVA